MGTSLVSSMGSTCPYDIGDILQTTNPKNPSERWNGTEWTQIKGKFLLGTDDSHTIGTTGGEAAHKLTIAEMPKHDHLLYYDYMPVRHDEDKHVFHTGSYNATNMYHTMPNAVDQSGYDQPHNNMPPYLAVYIWQRTA